MAVRFVKVPSAHADFDPDNPNFLMEVLLAASLGVGAAACVWEFFLEPLLNPLCG